MTSFSTQKQIAGLIVWFIISFAASAVGAIASIQAKAFYGQLVQPAWAPPPGAFGPVWTSLFTLMAIAAWLVWRTGGFSQNRVALSLFLVQLVFNALWSWLFFAWQLGFAALIDIVLMIVLIIATIVSFWPRSNYRINYLGTKI